MKKPNGLHVMYRDGFMNNTFYKEKKEIVIKKRVAYCTSFGCTRSATNFKGVIKEGLKESVRQCPDCNYVLRWV